MKAHALRCTTQGSLTFPVANEVVHSFCTPTVARSSLASRNRLRKTGHRFFLAVGEAHLTRFRVDAVDRRKVAPKREELAQLAAGDEEVVHLRHAGVELLNGMVQVRADFPERRKEALQPLVEHLAAAGDFFRVLLLLLDAPTVREGAKVAQEQERRADDDLVLQRILDDVRLERERR